MPDQDNPPENPSKANSDKGWEAIDQEIIESEARKLARNRQVLRNLFKQPTDSLRQAREQAREQAEAIRKRLDEFRDLQEQIKGLRKDLAERSNNETPPALRDFLEDMEERERQNGMFNREVRGIAENVEIASRVSAAVPE